MLGSTEAARSHLLKTPELPHGADDSGGVQPGVLATRLQHRVLNIDVMEEVDVKMAPGYEEFDDKTFQW